MIFIFSTDIQIYYSFSQTCNSTWLVVMVTCAYINNLIRDSYVSVLVGPGLTLNFFGKLSQNSEIVKNSSTDICGVVYHMCILNY